MEITDLDAADARRCLLWRDAASGLTAVLVIDDLSLGPAAGGARARALAASLGAEVLGSEALLRADLDVLSPCAVGGVVTAAVAAELRAWALCGAANNILADPQAARVLAARGVLHVPDEVASAGAVIEGIGRTRLGLPDRGPLIDALGATARSLLIEAATTGEPPTILAGQRVAAILAAARR